MTRLSRRALTLTLTILAGTPLALGPAASAQCGAPWTQIPGTGPGARSGHAMAYESATGRVILFGGFNDPGTWQYVGATGTWTLVTSTGPAPRGLPAMAYDSANAKIVLFGGEFSLSLSSETWLFDPLTNLWSNPAPALHPSARMSSGMVYDSLRQRIVLFGGQGSGAAGETWEYDTAANIWTHLFPAQSPPPDERPVMAFDPVRALTVLVAGGSTVLGPLGDQWEWDGITWTPVATVNPPPGAFYAAFDPAIGRLVAFRTDEAWDYDATTQHWTQHPAPGIGERYGMAMTFDPSRSVAILQGGYGTGSGTETFEWTAALSAGPSVTQSPLPLHATQIGQPASISVAASGNGPLAYQWLRDGMPLSDGNGISGSHSSTLTFNPLQRQHSGHYAATVTDNCGPVTTVAAYVLPEFGCYANCDGSTTPPFLNVNDFICFQQHFASGDTYANCDHASQPPILNVNDFICFMSLFSSGCP